MSPLTRPDTGGSLARVHTKTDRAVAAFDLPGETALPLPRRPLTPTEWSDLIEAASTQGLLGLLLAAITADAFPVTASQAEQARRLATEAVAYCLRLEGELLLADTVLRDLAIPVRVLKGPAAARLDYADPTLRSFVDIDLLIRSADFDAAVAGLSAAGYRRRRPQLREGFDRSFGKAVCFLSPGGIPLDVHRTFITGPFGLKVVLDDVWGPGDRFDVAGRTLSALPTEARLLHACYHAALGDSAPRLVPHRDIAQILLAGTSAAERVHELAGRWQAQAVVATGVSAAWDLLGISTDVALSNWARTYPISAVDAKVLQLHSHAGNSAAKNLAALSAVAGLRQKGAFLRALVLPERGYIAGRQRTWAAHMMRGLQQLRPTDRRDRSADQRSMR